MSLMPKSQTINGQTSLRESANCCRKNPTLPKMRVALGLLALIYVGDCARILAIVPLAVKSHYILMEPLLRALAARGHQLTVYTSFPNNSPVDNFTYIDCATGRNTIENNLDYEQFQSAMSNAFGSVHHLFRTANEDCEFVYKKSKLEVIVNKTFDLVIAEMFASDCFIHIAYRLGVPLVSIATNVPMPWTSDNFGLPDNPSYIPNSLSSYTPDMNLWQRVMNTLVLVYGKIMFKFISNPRSQRYAEEYYQEQLPWVEDIAKNSSLLLVNSHFSLSHSRPLPPNVVEVGGMHIKEKQPLPEDLQEILDRSSQGVILFTFGSMIRVSTFPEKKIREILNVFAKIPQTILMKYENDLPDAPENVIVRNWLPQRDILSHPNVVAFVSHAGLASVMEAVSESKPIVAVPFFSDQFLNTNNLIRKGAAVGIDFNSMTERDFEHAINQVLNNRKILEGMKQLSLQFRDRPMTPLQSAVYWTEYVLRHQGAPHLRPASTSLPLYQLWLLDVIAVLLATLVAVSTSVYWIINNSMTGKCLLIIRYKFYKMNKVD